MAETLILGIDLGTTNSLAAVMTPGGPQVIRDNEGNALIPSVIAFSNGKVTVGSEASLCFHTMRGLSGTGPVP